MKAGFQQIDFEIKEIKENHEKDIQGFRADVKALTDEVRYTTQRQMMQNQQQMATTEIMLELINQSMKRS
jgi:hypothetical protein